MSLPAQVTSTIGTASCEQEQRQPEHPIVSREVIRDHPGSFSPFSHHIIGADTESCEKCHYNRKTKDLHERTPADKRFRAGELSAGRSRAGVQRKLIISVTAVRVVLNNNGARHTSHDNGARHTSLIIVSEW